MAVAAPDALGSVCQNSLSAKRGQPASAIAGMPKKRLLQFDQTGDLSDSQFWQFVPRWPNFHFCVSTELGNRAFGGIGQSGILASRARLPRAIRKSNECVDFCGQVRSK